LLSSSDVSSGKGVVEIFPFDFSSTIGEFI
jgi:hypothetical protein